MRDSCIYTTFQWHVLITLDKEREVGDREREEG